MLNTSLTPSETIEVVRNSFRSHIPDSNAWIEPNNLSITATVIGGIAFTAMQEAKNGVDRYLPDTATGKYLDAVAARPPFNMLRRQATKATGIIEINGPDAAAVSIGNTFTRTDGIRYIAAENAPIVDGVVTVSIEAVDTGPESNAASGMPLDAGTVSSGGIAGGFCTETDDELRSRLYAFQARQFAFGSECSLLEIANSNDGVTRSWIVDQNGQQILYFVMDGAYPDSIPQPDDVARVLSDFKDGCGMPMGFCLFVDAPIAKIYRPEVFSICPNNKPAAELNADVSEWLIENIGLGQSVLSEDVETYLNRKYPTHKFSIKDNVSAAGCNEIYTVAEVALP